MDNGRCRPRERKWRSTKRKEDTVVE
jgi:hypothetical protein